MDIKYFHDTDTLFLVFNQNEVVSTADINENMIFDLDENGDPVSLTIEHVSNVNNLPFRQN